MEATTRLRRTNRSGPRGEKVNINIIALVVFAICTAVTVYMDIKGRDGFYYGWGAFISFFVAIEPNFIAN